MKSLERRFNNIKDKKSNWGSYLCFAEAIKNQNFNKDIVRRWFNKLVKNDDFLKSEKKAILAHLENLTNPLKATEIEGKSSL